MSDDARILMAQHAKTAQLFGVDFLPLGNAPAIVEPEPELQAEPKKESEHRSRQEKPTQVAASPELDLSSIEIMKSDALRAVYEQHDDAQARLDALASKYELDAPHQHFNTQFNKIVFGEGDPDAELMFIGDAPGADEDQCGQPFVGRAGQLLENMIKAMGLSRERVYITNVLKTCPPNNGTVTPQQAALCEPYLMEQIRIVNPKVIVTLGLPASQLLLKVQSPMRSMRGHWHTIRANDDHDTMADMAIMPTYHPAYLLRSYTEDNRRKVWSDLTQVIEKLGLKK